VVTAGDAQALAFVRPTVAARAGRGDKVGHNLIWLSRLHWYRGEAQQAENYANQAVCELEGLGSPCAELAMAYSVRSQLHMLHGDALAAAAIWTRLGLPYEAALVLMQVRGADADPALARAVQLLEASRGCWRMPALLPKNR
jgi:hypothetical protein